MKIISLKDLVALLGCVTLILSISSVTYAQDEDNGKHTGFEQGNHEGHLKDNGVRKGFENERNPWYDASQDDTGVDFELTIHNRTTNPGTVTGTYNSLMTIQELLTSLLGEATNGISLQECFEMSTPLGKISTCTDGETPTPLDNSLTLEAAGLLDDPEVYLVYTP
jgi:hypothetical protein